MMMVPLRVLTLLSLFILILRACSIQGEDNVGPARSYYKEFIIKESGVIGRKMMVDCLKKSIGLLERNGMNNVEGGRRKLKGKKTVVHVKEEQHNNNVGNLVGEENDMSGYVAFSADYKGPRHHPPKNN